MGSYRLKYTPEGVELVRTDTRVVEHVITHEVLLRWLECDYHQLEAIKRDSDWVNGFMLRTARISMGHSFDGNTVSLIVGGTRYDERHSIKLSFADAAALMCRELPDEAKSFYIEDLRICEVPKAQERWARYGGLSPRGGVRFDIYDTRDEAKTRLKAILQECLDAVDA